MTTEQCKQRLRELAAQADESPSLTSPARWLPLLTGLTTLGVTVGRSTLLRQGLSTGLSLLFKRKAKRGS